MNHHAQRFCLGIGMLSILFLVLPTPVRAASVCGPGDHWVDACSAGTATLRVHMEFGLDTNLDQVTDVEAAFDGTMVVKWTDPHASDPVADPTHLDRMGSQILSMSLTGAGGYVAGWTFRAGVDQGLAATTGYIQESSSDPAVAENRYNLVFNIDGTPFGTLHHTGSLFFTSNITGFPQVGADYQHLGALFGTYFSLYDSNDVHVLTMTDLFNTDHISVGRPDFVVTAVVPLPPALLLFVSGLASLMLAARARSARSAVD